MTSQERAFREFSDFTAKLKGDEKSKAQTFLFHLLAAFGHDPNIRGRRRHGRTVRTIVSKSNLVHDFETGR